MFDGFEIRSLETERGAIHARVRCWPSGSPWARDVRGHRVDTSHFLVEDRPEEVASELAAFFEDRR